LLWIFEHIAKTLLAVDVQRALCKFAVIVLNNLSNDHQIALFFVESIVGEPSNLVVASKYSIAQVFEAHEPAVLDLYVARQVQVAHRVPAPS